MLRTIRIFFKALAMTLRGEKPKTEAERRYPRLAAWLQVAESQIETVYQVAETAGYTMEKREAAVVRVDGRDVSVETILAGVRYHLKQEYPYMLKHLTEHSLTGIYATNLNDRYAIKQLSENIDLPERLQPAITKLSEHLENIPPTQPENATS
jgi:hypothetical protein